jgi:hypothetical protein
MKTCITCGVVKPLGEFYRAAGMRDGHRNDCKVCNLAAKKDRYRADPQAHIDRVRRWQIEHPERVRQSRRERNAKPEIKRRQRDAYYLRSYGISADEADEILAAQNGRCAICCTPATDRLASMHLDHDHDTGAIRGFLCIDCNHGLGKLRDSADLLLRALVYLRQRQEPDALTGSGVESR